MDHIQEEILALVKHSRSYNTVADSVILRVVAKELKNSSNKRMVVKRVKSELHQIYGAFNKDVNYEKIFSSINAAFLNKDKETLRQALVSAMQASNSSGERIPVLDHFYKNLFAITGYPKRVLDLACGLNPLSFLYLGFPKDIQYFAYDIGEREIDFLNRTFRLLGYSEMHASAIDLLVDVPREEVDIALLLKTMPSIEVQQKGRMLAIAKGLHAKFIVISFSTFNLGIIKRKRNVEDLYVKDFRGEFSEVFGDVKEFTVDGELVFVIKK